MTRIDDLIGQLSLEEKALLLTGKTAWRTWGLPAIGLEEMVLSDGPVGVRGTNEEPGETSQCLPSPTALAACWDTVLAHRVGRWFANEARTHGAHVVLAPVVNIQRSPVGGRHFECFSEDPILTGDIAVALIQGMQQESVAACVKHYVGNEVEKDRTHYLSHIDEQALREVYLAPFERAVQAGVWSVMASYNRTEAGGEINSMVAHHYLLTKVLKQEWGFEGPVVSDWTAVNETIPPAIGGLDLVMPGPLSPWSDGELVEAVRTGLIKESLVDDKVRRLLWLAEKVGALPRESQHCLRVDEGGDTSVPREVAARGCVVLSNVDDSLPIANPSAIRTIALIGPNAQDTHLLGGGSASVAIAHPISLGEGLSTGFPEATIRFSQGVRSRRNPPELDLSRCRIPGSDGSGVLVEFLDDSGVVVESQVRTTWSGSFAEDIPEGCTSIHIVTTVFLEDAGTHWLGVGTIGRHRIFIDSTEVSASDHLVGGEVFINSSFNVPPARGTEVIITTPRWVTIEALIQHIPTQWGPRARAALHHGLPAPAEEESIAEAVRLAEASDLTIVVVGTNEETESEGWDRTNLDLPGRQNDLVDAVLDSCPNAIILVNAGSPVILPWLDRARTVIWFWFPGQEAGTALSDILTGVTEPSGRLPWTLPDAHEHCPVPFGQADPQGTITYDDGVHVGYRGWARTGLTPARYFGFGLGWTSWQLRSSRVLDQSEQGVEIAVRLINTGPRAGSTVVQAYLRPPSKTSHPSDRPCLWLAGYSRVHADRSEEIETVITIPHRAFQVWQPANGEMPGEWVVPSGTYTLAIGHNAGDLPLEVDLAWT